MDRLTAMQVFGTPGSETFIHVLARERLTISKVDYGKITFIKVTFPQLSDVMAREQARNGGKQESPAEPF